MSRTQTIPHCHILFSANTGKDMFSAAQRIPAQQYNVLIIL